MLGMAVLLVAPRVNTQPSNDSCSTPTVIGSLPYTNSEDTSAATTDGSDPLRGCIPTTQDLASVWYSFTAAASGTIQIATTGSDYHTDVSVWTGSCGTLTEVYCDGLGPAVRSMDVTAGTAYLIEVTAYYYKHVNGGLLDIVISVVPPPSNDACSAATTIGALPFTDTIDTRGATTDGSDPIESCTGNQGTKSVWYKYTAPGDGFVAVGDLVNGTDYFNTLVAYTGACGALTEVDIAGGILSSSTHPMAMCVSNSIGFHAAIPMRSGEALFVEITDDYFGYGGTLAFHADVGHDAIVKSLAPKRIKIPAGRSSVTKRASVLVTNGDVSAPPGGRMVTITSVSGCGAIGADFDSKTAGDQTTVNLGPGKSATATVSLQLSKDDYVSLNSKSPDRCTLSVCADSPSYIYDEGTPNNNCTSVDINIFDENDF